MLTLTYRLSLTLFALLLTATATIATAAGANVMIDPASSILSTHEAVSLCGLAAGALACLFLVQRVLERTYEDW